MRTTASVMRLICMIFFVVAAEDVFNTLPPPVITSFTCTGRDSGFYADIENNCRVYHTCDDHGNKFTYYCPQDTAFRQDALVCDHAYLVDCAKSAQLIARVPENFMNGSNEFATDSNINQRSNTYSRSYRINVKPSIFLLAPKESDEDTTTFVMSSTVFLRDQSRPQTNHQSSNNNRNLTSNKILPKNYSSTTLRPHQFNPNSATTKTDFLHIAKSRNFNPKTDSITSINVKSDDQKFVRPLTTFQHNRNYPYSETLRSIQTEFSERLKTTTPKITTAGTEFPIPSLVGALAKFDNSDDDPYYPNQTENTPVYYTSIAERKHRKIFHSNTHRPWQRKLDLKIPDVLPDLNSLEDLVDRRKHLYIKKKIYRTKILE